MSTHAPGDSSEPTGERRDVARSFFERVRRLEPTAPPELADYLDWMARRAADAAGIRLDVGSAGEDIDARCRRALMSLVHHGWVQVGPSPRPAGRRGLAADYSVPAFPSMSRPNRSAMR